MASKGYTTEANVEAYIGEAIDATTTPTSTQLDVFIEWAEKQIDDFTDTAFTSTTETDQILDSEGMQRFRLPKRPIISVTNFYVDKAGLGSVNSPDWEARSEGRTDTDDFVLLKDVGVLHFHHDIPPYGIQNVKTTYVYGYATVPKDVEKLATLLVVKEILKTKLSNATFGSAQDITVGPISLRNSIKEGSMTTSELDKEIEEAWKAVGRFKAIAQ